MTIRILSWNMALFERSAQAPEHWSVHDTEAAVRDAVLEIKPDIVAFQELPAMVPYVETLNMVKTNPRTHSGNLATLATHRLFDPPPVFTSVASCAILCHFPALKLTVANVHLQSGKAAAADRFDQLGRVMGATNGKRVVIIGDTNTRNAEMESVQQLGLETPELPTPTWDGRRNRFRADGHRFSAFFTRVFHTPDLSMASMAVLTAPLEVDDHRFHLSDHFPLLVEVENQSGPNGGRSGPKKPGG